MRGFLVMASVVLVATVAAPLDAQMRSGMMMGGPRSMLNLVSPATSPTQVQRGVLTLNSMMGGSGTSMMGGSSGPSTAGRLRLVLVGVVNGGALVTSTGNRLMLTARLTSAAGSDTPVTVDQQFDITAGVAVLFMPLTLPSFTPPATLQIGSVEVLDSSGSPFAVEGVAFGRPLPSPIPSSGSCRSDADCDDGNPNTQDVCSPMGCQHMGGHTGPGGGPMM